MPTYEIEQYELHAQLYRVEADNKAEAIKKLYDGDGEAVDNGLAFIEASDGYGLSAEGGEFDDLVDELRAIHVEVGDVIHGIRSIEEA